MKDTFGSPCELAKQIVRACAKMFNELKRRRVDYNDLEQHFSERVSNSHFADAMRFAEQKGWLLITRIKDTDDDGETILVEDNVAIAPGGWDLLDTDSHSDAKTIKKARRPRTRPGETPQWFPQAITLKKDTPGMSDAEIARQVGVSPSTLCESQAWKDARKYWVQEKPRASKFTRSGGTRKALPNAKSNDEDEE